MNLKNMFKNLVQGLSSFFKSNICVGIFVLLMSFVFNVDLSFSSTKQESKDKDDSKSKSVSVSDLESKPESLSEIVRAKIFSDKEKSYCKVVSKSFDSQLSKYDLKLETLVKELLVDLKKKRVKSLVKKFHPRLKMNAYEVKTKIFTPLSSAVFTDPSFSLFRVWALDSKSSGSSYIDCDKEFRMNPHYGYDVQFGVWIQIMSQVELGWIYTTIVPHRSGWVLASFDLRQLSSEGKQAISWQQEAREDYEKKLLNLAYLKFDVAKKLSYTGGYIYIKNLDSIQNDIESRFSDTNPLLKTFSPYMEGRTLLRAESNFSSLGVGIFIRYGVTWKESDNILNQQCRRIAKNIMKIPELQSLKGLRCSFSLPGENLGIDGARGTLFVPKGDQIKTDFQSK